MTKAEVYTMLSQIGTPAIPAAYHHFAEGSGQQPPFICFYYPVSDDMMADNANYAHISQLIVELYTDNKDFVLEAAVETALASAGLSWMKEETYIEDEKMYLEAYTMEVIIS